jgi:hypothetical protein
MILYSQGRICDFIKTAPAQYVENVQQWLNATYPGSWIGRGGPISWPLRLLGSKLYRHFPVGIREGIYCVYAVTPRPIKDLVATYQADLCIDNGFKLKAGINNITI